MKIILAFGASNSKISINKAFATYAANQLNNVKITIVDLNDYEMPIYSLDREGADGVHPRAKAFYEKIGKRDAIIVSFAEHNGFVTAAWKNIFDWMSRIDTKVWQDKPAVILAATPGWRAGANVLQTQETMAPFFGMDIKGKYGVGHWPEARDGTKLVKDGDVDRVDLAIRGLLTAQNAR